MQGAAAELTCASDDLPSVQTLAAVKAVDARAVEALAVDAPGAADAHVVDADVVDANAVLVDTSVVSHAAGQQIDVVVVVIDVEIVQMIVVAQTFVAML